MIRVPPDRWQGSRGRPNRRVINKRTGFGLGAVLKKALVAGQRQAHRLGHVWLAPIGTLYGNPRARPGR